MLKHISKIIWNERKINAWILVELIIVFCILWFCVDYLYFVSTRYFQPMGFDIEHTYRVDISARDEGLKIAKSDDEVAKEAMYEDIWTVYERIKKHPAVEYVSYSLYSCPYGGSRARRSQMIDSVEVPLELKMVSPDYFNVFNIDITSGVPFTWENIVNDDVVILSPDEKGLLGGKSPGQVKQIGVETVEKVIGIAGKSRFDEFSDYSAIAYAPLNKKQTQILRFRDICIRVKPEADKNFVEQFKKDMRSQLQVGYYYLSGVKPISKIREEYMDDSESASNLKSIYSVSTFLILNIFLGIIGTFWFRVQTRRNEIGLRLALGLSKNGVKRTFLSETFILLFLASIVGSVICLNIAGSDLLQSLNIPVAERSEDSVGWVQYIINYGLTFSFLFLISLVAVWYPARRASRIAPASALRDE